MAFWILSPSLLPSVCLSRPVLDFFFISLFHVRSCLDDSVTDGCITPTLPGEDGAGNYGHTRRHLFSSVYRLHFFLKTSDSRYPCLFLPLPHERRFPAVSSLFVLLFFGFYTRQRFCFLPGARESYHALMFFVLFCSRHTSSHHSLREASTIGNTHTHTHRLARAKKRRGNCVAQILYCYCYCLISPRVAQEASFLFR